jgi:hypothetical protein
MVKSIPVEYFKAHPFLLWKMGVQICKKNEKPSQTILQTTETLVRSTPRLRVSSEFNLTVRGLTFV